MEYKIGNTMLYLYKVGVSYGKTEILRDITLEEKDVTIEGRNTGQVIAILGRSGRGKSTLFKVLTGLIKPSWGQVLIPDSNDILKPVLVKEGDVAFVDQKYTLFRHKTIKESLLYALRKTDLSNNDKLHLVHEQLQNWNLLAQKDKYPNELSGGQRQRTAILEKLLMNSRYIVFDEPASGLDVGNIEKLKSSFDMISRQDDLNTIIFSTHDINLAVELADSIYIIGHKEPTDTVSTIVSHYDLKALGLAWTKFGSSHLKLVEQIKQDLLKS